MHVTTEPNILYFGTPVVLISTVNEETIISRMRRRASAGSFQFAAEFIATASASELAVAARSRGGQPPRAHHRHRSCAEGQAASRLSYEKSKFEIAGMTAVASETIAAPRALECPVQMEGVLEAHHGLAEDDKLLRGRVTTFEVRIQRVHVDEALLVDGKPDHIDPDKWRPLIMSFQKFYGLGDGQVHPSKLGSVPEKYYRSPDVDRSRASCGA